MPTGAEALKQLKTPFIDTRRAERRTVALASFDDLSREVDRIVAASQPGGEGVRVTGNWSAGQILHHLTRTIVRSMDGFSAAPSSEQPVPGGLAGLAAKAQRSRAAAEESELRSRLLAPNMPPNAPSAALPGEIEPAAQIWTPDAAGLLRVTLQRIAAKHPMDKPSPAMGRLTDEQWRAFHLRHAELHLSFILPGQWQ